MSLLSNVSDAAAWGSLAASTALGAYMLTQAFVASKLRAQFSLFAVICLTIALTDATHRMVGETQYEILRILLWACSAASLLWIFEYRISTVTGALFALPLFGAATWFFFGPTLAAALVVSTSFGIAAAVFSQHYLSLRGYASLVLAVLSSALALTSALEFAVLEMRSPLAIGLSYAHYAITMLLGVIFGWVYLPRELRGTSPVEVDLRVAVGFTVAVLGCELFIVPPLLIFGEHTMDVSLAMLVLQPAALLFLYFYHRDRLVIYTDNVRALLEERTESLRYMQRQLARQNEIQARKLVEQAEQLNAKAAVIERQRRLELAAQTAGQTAHDIQNLVSPILVHLDALSTAVSASPASLERALLIRRQLELLLELNSQLLALARRGKLEQRPLCLSDILADLQKLFPHELIHYSGNQQIWVQGSAAQLLRAFANLVSNAIEAATHSTHSKKEVRITTGKVYLTNTKRCHLGFLAPGDYVFIEISDNGSGIPADQIDRIFEPFFSRKNEGKSSGSGLGLSITAAVMEDHSGTIDLRSDPDGTTFTLYIPAIASPSQNEELSGGEETILFVDHDQNNIQKYEEALGNAGYYVVTANDGREALQILQSEHVDLLVLDLNTSSRKGLETVFGAIHLRPGIRTIIHSETISETDALALRQFGVSAFLTRPASIAEILFTCRRILDEQEDLPRTGNWHGR